MCSIADANGAPAADLTFEDYLKNMPNVIGSSGYGGSGSNTVYVEKNPPSRR